MLSQKARYSLRALVALARTGMGKSLMISEIAQTQDIPKKFLEQILLELKRNGIVESRRGKTGGYLLQKNPEDISFGEIIRIIDGPLAPLACLSKVAYKKCLDCKSEENCEIRHVFAEVATQTRAALDGTTLAQAIASVDISKDDVAAEAESYA